MSFLRRYRFVSFFIMFAIFSAVPTDTAHCQGVFTRIGHLCKDKSQLMWHKFWNNKKIVLPAAVGLGFMGWEAVELFAMGKYNNIDNKNYAKNAQALWKGFAGLAMFPLIGCLHAADLLYQKSSNKQPYMTTITKCDGKATFDIPRYASVKSKKISNKNSSKKKSSSSYDTDDVIDGYDSKTVSLDKMIIKQYHGATHNDVFSCGYYALNAALNLKTGNLAGLFDEKAFEKKTKKWKNAVGKMRGNVDDWESINSGEIGKIIRDYIPQLRGRYYEDGMRDVYLKDNVSIIDNLDQLERMITTATYALAGQDLHTFKNIKIGFRKKRKDQFVIVNSSSNTLTSSYDCNFHYLLFVLKNRSDGSIEVIAYDPLGADIKNSPIIDHLCYIFKNVTLASNVSV